MSVSIELVKRNIITFWTVTVFNYLSQTLQDQFFPQAVLLVSLNLVNGVNKLKISCTDSTDPRHSFSGT